MLPSTTGRQLLSVYEQHNRSKGCCQEQSDKGVIEADMEPCRMTLDEWLDIWLRDYLTGVKPSTAYLYQRQAKRYSRPAACILPKIIKKDRP